VRKHELVIVQYLIETCRVDPHVQNASQETALHLASAYRDPEIALYLIPKCMARAATLGAKLAPIDWVNDSGQTALHIASQCGHCRIVQCLLQVGRATFDALDGNGQTALHLAAANRQVGATLLLVRRLAVDKSDETDLEQQQTQQQRSNSQVLAQPSKEESSRIKRPKRGP
jgi:ankyrin repeat protein